MHKTITRNDEIARILKEIGEYLDMQGVAFKPRAYAKAAETIEALSEEVGDIYTRGGMKALKEIPGVGASIAETIEELIVSGKSTHHEELKKKTPVDLSSLSRVEGLGPKKIRTLYQKLGVRTLAELEKAVEKGKVAPLEGFGKKSEENIKKGIGFAKSAGERAPLGVVMPEAAMFVARLAKVKGVEKVTAAGSVRRRKETIGDMDILVASENAAPIMDYFVHMPEVVNVVAHGETKSSVKIKSGLNLDLRVVPKISYGAALNYFTGSKDHNVALRQIALEKGFKLNEYGLWKIADTRRSSSARISADKNPHPSASASIRDNLRSNPHPSASIMVAGKTEEEIYKTLGMDYIEPELRERAGEINAALRHQLPALVGYGDLKGDLQVQTNWTDGSASIEEMAHAAAKAGLEYIAITDHTKRLAMTHGLDDARVLKQIAEIARVNKRFHASGSRFQVLSGSECDILKDGSLDLDDVTLAKLDVVGASVHSYFNLPKDEQTKRIMRAMDNPNVDIIFHPTGRILGKRPPYEVDMQALIAHAKKTKTILEIDAFDRLDLKDEYIRMCVDAGVKMAIDSDAHAPEHFAMLEYGIAQARRGWATKHDIINAWPLEKMRAMLKK